ncbi:MAG TPA: 30S ribosomal protein S8 [Alphaproteobacteria bacterium]|nr:30S ribosomal protein S8 [Alphaproteobacteria bacterium]
MSVTDTLGDMLTRIRNGQMAGMAVVSCPASSFRKQVLEALVREGYIRGYTEVQHKSSAQATLEIELKYHEGAGAIQKIERVSTPGRRVYAGIKDLGRVFNGLGVSILSTPRGVLSDNEARAQHVGGEVLCRIF